MEASPEGHFTYREVAMNGHTIPSTRRFAYGGLGSLLPTLYTLAVGKDLQYFTHPSAEGLLGWCIRTGALFALGGMVAVFMKTTLKTAKAIFLAGVIAPGFVRGVISQDGASVFAPSQASSEEQSAPSADKSVPQAPAQPGTMGGVQSHPQHLLLRTPAPAPVLAAPPPPPPPPEDQARTSQAGVAGGEPGHGTPAPAAEKPAPKGKPVQPPKAQGSLKRFLVALRG